MPYSLTPVMQDCARVIGELTDALGRAPSVAAVAREMDLCKSRCWFVIQSLVERGWVERRGRGKRLVLLYRPPPIVEGPVALTEQGRAVMEAAA